MTNFPRDFLGNNQEKVQREWLTEATLQRKVIGNNFGNITSNLSSCKALTTEVYSNPVKYVRCNVENQKLNIRKSQSKLIKQQLKFHWPA